MERKLDHESLYHIFNETCEIARIGVWELNAITNEVLWSKMIYEIHEMEPDTPITVEEGINFYHPDYKPIIEKAVEEGIKNRIPWDLELILITKTGKEKWVRAIGKPLIKNGKLVALRGLFQDIDKAKRAELKEEKNKKKLEKLVEERTKKLQIANEELEGFSYSVSHDLRAPLRALEGFSRLLVSEYGDKLDERGKTWLNFINTNTIKMDVLIQDMLTFSRISRAQIRKMPINMEQMVREIVREEEENYKNHQVKLDIPNLITGFGDPQSIRQVWVNLISNAFKYSSKNDTIIIKINSNKNNSTVEYSISDNGVGFDPAYAPKLFGVFQRLHSEGDFEGTGVGLAITKKVIDKHGGEIHAESKPGKGTTFTFKLPLEK